MIPIKGGTKEQVVRHWLNDECDGKLPNGKVLDQYERFKQSPHAQQAELSYGLFNGVLKKIEVESGEHRSTKADSVESAEPVTAQVIRVEDMQFPNFRLHRTGKKIDHLFSDHEEGGGLYGGTVNIVIGESGVGKSTVMLDLLASVCKTSPEAKVLYVSSEMTRNDILFYYRKCPSIGQVPTLLLMDYVKTGQLDKVLESAFNGEWDIVLLDSYQDVLVKLKEVQGWRSTHAESWLTGMMIDSAEKNGCSVLAIQHMTKGGTYVGSTYLKHATTSMLEIRFDLSGQRYIEFSKNRRGGSGTGKRLYYSLDEHGDVVYDEARFKETEEMLKIESNENARQYDLTRRFEEVFLNSSSHDEPEVEELEAEEVEG